jgi:hypothetical protein
MVLLALPQYLLQKLGLVFVTINMLIGKGSLMIEIQMV